MSSSKKPKTPDEWARFCKEELKEEEAEEEENKKRQDNPETAINQCSKCGKEIELSEIYDGLCSDHKQNYKTLCWFCKSCRKDSLVVECANYSTEEKDLQVKVILCTKCKEIRDNKIKDQRTLMDVQQPELKCEYITPTPGQTPLARNDNRPESPGPSIAQSTGVSGRRIVRPRRDRKQFHSVWQPSSPSS